MKKIVCHIVSCEASLPDDRWSKIKNGTTWFFSKASGKSYCPDHIPEWVQGWRDANL